MYQAQEILDRSKIEEKQEEQKKEEPIKEEPKKEDPDDVKLLKSIESELKKLNKKVGKQY